MIYFRSGIERWSATRPNVEQAGFTICNSNRSEFEDDDIILNWGGVSPINNGRVWNNPQNVINCSDKLKTLAIIPDFMPPTFTEYSTDIPTPFVGKTNHTSKGLGKRRFRFHSRKVSYNNYDFFQPYLNIQEEYRVLVLWNGKRYTLPRIYKKVKTDEVSKRPLFHPSWDFQKQELDTIDTDIKQKCIQATKALEMQLVGIDFVITDTGNFVLEVNSAPGMGINTAAKIFKKLQEA